MKCPNQGPGGLEQENDARSCSVCHRLNLFSSFSFPHSLALACMKACALPGSQKARASQALIWAFRGNPCQKRTWLSALISSWRTFRKFLFFLLLRGRGKGGRVRGETGGHFYLEIERGGWVPRRGDALVLHTGARRVSRGGGGAKYFFRGRTVHQVVLQCFKQQC